MINKFGQRTMHITSIETTPNPNSMKLNLDQNLGAAITYTPESKSSPDFVEQLLQIGGLQSVFVCADFVTLNKDPRVDWRPILEKATAVLTGGEQAAGSVKSPLTGHSGQNQVLVQTFKGVPVQVKIVDADGETRLSFGSSFNEAAQQIQEKTGADYLKERYWADHGVRYGERDKIAMEVLQELQATFDADSLQHAVDQALGKTEKRVLTLDVLRRWLNDIDWSKRLLAVQELSGSQEAVPLLATALKDENVQVRRLAAASLGTTGSAAAVAPLCDALLTDSSVAVRRTAGDALSDLGDQAAQPSMLQALSDDNKLVRWRAARFLTDVGNADALPFLEKQKDDPAFEVRLEIEAAIQRIRGGQEGIGPAWKRIVENKD
jgi:3-methyladenine DNA glycosylase AlkD